MARREDHIHFASFVPSNVTAFAHIIYVPQRARISVYTKIVNDFFQDGIKEFRALGQSITTLETIIIEQAYKDRYSFLKAKNVEAMAGLQTMAITLNLPYIIQSPRDRDLTAKYNVGKVALTAMQNTTVPEKFTVLHVLYYLIQKRWLAEEQALTVIHHPLELKT